MTSLLDISKINIGDKVMTRGRGIREVSYKHIYPTRILLCFVGTDQGFDYFSDGTLSYFRANPYDIKEIIL